MPRILGSYELLFHIASGGMAEVFAARKRGEAGFERLVAVKRMLPNLADHEEFMTMFLDEGRLAGHIQSPHVVQTTDLGRSGDGSPYIVMDLVLGVTLSELCRATLKEDRKVPLDIVAELVAQAGQGLHDAHEARTPAGEPLQLVHRDVTPQNILVGVDGRARITDFGVARAMMRYSRTTTGQLKGKFGYFSPEQVSGKRVDRRSDIFSLGVVAWEAITGKRLYRGENPLESIHRLMHIDAPPLTEMRDDVPDEIARVVASALTRDPDERVSTAIAFAHDLREAARATVGAATSTDIGAYVEDVGGARLRGLQGMIRMASSPEGLELLRHQFEGEADEGKTPGRVKTSDIPNPNLTATVTRTPTVQSSPTGRRRVARVKKRRRVLIAAGAILVSGGVGAFLAIPTERPPDEMNVEVGPAQAVEVAPQAETVPVVAEAPKAKEPATPAPEPKTETKTESHHRSRRRSQPRVEGADLAKRAAVLSRPAPTPAPAEKAPAPEPEPEPEPVAAPPPETAPPSPHRRQEEQEEPKKKKGPGLMGVDDFERYMKHD